MILFCSLKASSQPRCSVLHYSTEDGLPHNWDMCITKDHEGFMWFGTWAGITRFDDHNFVSFRSQSGERSNFETNRIDGIVEDANGFLWLRTYKAQSGKASLQISNADIILLTRQVTDFFSEAFREKQIQIRIHAQIQELRTWIDAEKIETVLYNLLGNALKFSPPASTITISVKNSTNPGWFIIKVSDEGTGVDPAELEKIFQLYYESHHPQQTHLKGSGIGLALSKEFIELHHGNLSILNS